jgi:aspartyl-tRNA(Asn)/glutamyl-tRNA(Gln) amidotransferase subunit C
MSKLTKADVLHVAKLAKLNLSEAEIKMFLPQLSSVIDHIGNLSKVDTANVEPTSQTTGLTDVFRDDEIKESSLDQDKALSGSEKIYNGYFRVPAILSERTDK